MFTEIFCQLKQNYTKMNTLFNSAADWGCFQRALIFELHFDYKSMAQSSF